MRQLPPSDRDAPEHPAHNGSARLQGVIRTLSARFATLPALRVGEEEGPSMTPDQIEARKATLRAQAAALRGSEAE
jgi:hypothetical protein